MKIGDGVCADASLVAAYLLEEQGYDPWFLILRGEIGHSVTIYQENELWGAIGFSEKESLRGRDPTFKSLDSIAKDYLHAMIEANYPIFGLQATPAKLIEMDWRHGKEFFLSTFVEEAKEKAIYYTIFPNLSKFIK